ncbi:uncharacterized protein LOC128232130 [Mya arenaria]|uniref:uncharacterized protein LOC128232130 n=1 Tax=Mya arenaria TaxID=6604 RepID=UPI0022E87AC0|nr:uncharacterized protein LOC128232130 [Mya arenaria]
MMDVTVRTPSDGHLHVQLEASDNVSHVHTFIKGRLGIDEHDQILIDLYSDKPVRADDSLEQYRNGGFCSFYVATDRQCFREDELGDQEHKINKLIYCLVTGSEKLSTIMSIADENIDTKPFTDVSTNTNRCIQELDWCKGEIHMRTIIRLDSESEIIDPIQMRGALIHVNTVFERLKQRFLTFRENLRLFLFISKTVCDCTDMLENWENGIKTIKNKADEFEKNQENQKRFAKDLQKKVKIMFDNASSCQIEGDAAASEKVLNVRNGTKRFLKKLIETITKDAENILSIKELLTGATTNENINFQHARKSVKQFESNFHNVQAMANLVIQNGNDCTKYCREQLGFYERQLPGLQKTQYEAEENKKKIDEKLADLRLQCDNLRELEKRLSTRLDELIEIRDNPFKYLWNAVVTTAAIALVPLTAGLSLGLLGLIRGIDWNNLDSVRDGLREVRRNQQENEEKRKSVKDEIDGLSKEREKLTHKTERTSKNMETLKTSIQVLPKISSGVGKVSDSVDDVVQTFKDFEKVTFSFDVRELLMERSMSYKNDPHAIGGEIQFTKEEEAVILIGKLEFVDKHVLNMLNMTKRLLKVLRNADELINGVQEDGRSVVPNLDKDIYVRDPGKFKYRSAYDAVLQVLRTRAARLRSSLESMHTASDLLELILSLFSKKYKSLEDITSLYNEVLAMLGELDISQHCTDFAAESRNEEGNENDDETSPKEVADDMQTHMDGEEQHDANTILPGAEGIRISMGVPGSTEGTEQPQDYVGDDQEGKQRVKEKLNEYINAMLDL